MGKGVETLRSANQMFSKPILKALGVSISMLCSVSALAIPISAGPTGMDPTKIPQMVTPLTIPPEMPKSPTNSDYNQGEMTEYNIAMRQFGQQILPTSGCVVGKALLGFVAPVCTNVDPKTKSGKFKPTKVWGYGRADDATPPVAPVPATLSSFNYPSFTMEAVANNPTSVRWINELVALDPATGKPYPLTDPNSKFLPPLTAIDRSLHWANPEQLPCRHPDQNGVTTGRVDCEPDPELSIVNGVNVLDQAYTGPTPMVVHVHGIDVNSQSDGYSEAWWLPKAANIPASYGSKGTLYDQFFTNNTTPASAAFNYENGQAPTTLWFHDHSLGITRNNVYSGPTGFWLLRGDYTKGSNLIAADKVSEFVAGASTKPGKLPGDALAERPTNPNLFYALDANGVWSSDLATTAQKGCDPNFDALCRANIREIPLVIQDRSFNADGSLFFPASRDFFQGYAVPYKPNAKSDIAPLWNPEFFGNTMVVNGNTWPRLKVAKQRYRFRLLNGTDARTLSLAMYAMPKLKLSDQIGMSNLTLSKHVASRDTGYKEIPFYQIGAEQGYLPKVVKVTKGTSVQLPGNGTEPPAPVCIPTNALTGAVGNNPLDPLCEKALLMMPAERADVVVDFSSLAVGAVVRVVNLGPDAPFGGFPVGLAAADSLTTGRVMTFEVVADTGVVSPAGIPTPFAADISTVPSKLILPAETANTLTPNKQRKIALMEGESEYICVSLDATGGLLSAFNPGKQADDGTWHPNVPFNDAEACLVDSEGNSQPSGIPYAPKHALLGTVDGNGVLSRQPWMNPITAAPKAGDTEDWEIYNTTVDSHPVHLHLVRFQVLNRETMLTNVNPNGTIHDVQPGGGATARPMELTETGYKDTVIAYPGEITRVRATFERAGLYVWHCHIVDHEDNEMMVPMVVTDPTVTLPHNAVDDTLSDMPIGNTGKTLPIVNNGAGL
ncbi:MAG: multicopper oxidase, partial [Pseudomonadota bacterium]